MRIDGPFIGDDAKYLFNLDVKDAIFIDYYDKRRRFSCWF